MQEVKVSFYLKRNEEKTDGTTPILGRIRIGKSMVQFSAKVYVLVSLWDTKSGRAIGKSKTALSTNTSLNKICVAIHSAYRELSLKKNDISALEVKNAFQGIASEQDTLVKYFETHNEKFLQNVGVNRAEGTYKRFLTSLGHLKCFMRKKYNISDISFQALTPSFVADYDYYLRIELGLACGTIINTIVHLRRIIRIAINNGLVRSDPFIDYCPLLDIFETSFFDKDKVKTTSIVSFGLKSLIKLSGTDSMYHLWTNKDKEELLKNENSKLLDEYKSFCTEQINNFFIPIKRITSLSNNWTSDRKNDNRVLSTTVINGFIICLRRLIANGKVGDQEYYMKQLAPISEFSFNEFKSSQYSKLADKLYKECFES